MKRLRKASVVLLIAIVAAELLARVKMSYNTGDVRYLGAPFFQKKAAAAQDPGLAPYFVEYNGYYKMRPGVHAAPPGSSHDRFTVNRLGFRGPDFDPRHKAAARRIICVGDSNTAGLEANEDETWPAMLARALNRQGPGGFEVINAGFGGYTSSHYLNLIRAELLDYSPDLLIIMGGVNDQNPERNLESREGRALVKFTHGLLYYRSIAYTLALEKISVMRNDSPVPMTVYENNQYLNSFARNTAAIIDLCRKKNVRLVFVREIVNGDERLSKRMDQEAAVLKNLCETHSVPYLDLTRPFSEAMQAGVKVFSDPIHLGTAGYAILVDRISRFLADEATR
jgi:lysophospholipase L1-like esterase